MANTFTTIATTINFNSYIPPFPLFPLTLFSPCSGIPRWSELPYFRLVSTCPLPIEAVLQENLITLTLFLGIPQSLTYKANPSETLMLFLAWLLPTPSHLALNDFIWPHGRTHTLVSMPTYALSSTSSLSSYAHHSTDPSNSVRFSSRQRSSLRPSSNTWTHAHL